MFHAFCHMKLQQTVLSADMKELVIGSKFKLYK